MVDKTIVGRVEMLAYWTQTVLFRRSSRFIINEHDLWDYNENAGVLKDREQHTNLNFESLQHMW